MRTVYTQDDAPDLKRKGQAHRASQIIYITPISNGVEVEVEGTPAVKDAVAVASDGQQVWPLNEQALAAYQRAKRPPAVKNPTAKAGTVSKK